MYLFKNTYISNLNEGISPVVIMLSPNSLFVRLPNKNPSARQDNTSFEFLVREAHENSQTIQAIANVFGCLPESEDKTPYTSDTEHWEGSSWS